MINQIDVGKCTGCGTCYKTCALDVFRIQTDQDNLSPCMATCPAGIDIRGYNALMQQGCLAEAAQELKKANPFPAITGRVCPRPCESECQRTKVDQAVNINALEQFLGDMELPEKPEKSPVRHVTKIAVVGSGPAGLSCAWFMAKKGYSVTVFEAFPEPGGMLRYGIPAYRLPTEVVEAQVAQLKALGIRFTCNVRVGDGGDLSLSELKERGYKAVCLAPGTTKSRSLNIPGVDLPGVFHGVNFLHAVRSGMAPAFSGTVVVIGGGDVAMDAALTAKRLGAAQVELVCLECDDAIPAFAHNIADAKAAGVMMHAGWGPVRIKGKGTVTGLQLRRCLSVCDENQVFAPVFDDSDTMEIKADKVICAIGQSSDLEPFRKDVAVDAGNRIEVDPVTFGTSIWNIFAAGDAVTGSGSVIEAITGGREAAISIDLLLSGAHQHSDRQETRQVAEKLPGEGVVTVPRLERSRNSGAAGFAEVRQGFDTINALEESMRCMTCGAKARVTYRDDCMTCFFCELRCPAEAIDVHPFKERLPYTLESNFGGY